MVAQLQPNILNPDWRFITQASPRQGFSLLTSKKKFRDMRYQLLKLTKGHSTKAERRFAELLKRYNKPFLAKIKIGNREIDFLVKGKYAFEIDGHKQDPSKNQMLLDRGFIPYHLYNWEVVSPAIREWIKDL